MRHNFQFTVHSTPGRPWCAFNNNDAAQEYARWLSTRHLGYTVEVRHASGIVGQYKNGLPTPEFQGRGDERYPRDRLEDFTSYKTAERVRP